MTVLILGLILFVCAGCAVNPISGEGELMLFPEDQDVAIGQKYAPEVEKEMGGRIDNEQLQSYIDSIGQKIARVSHRPDLEYHFVALQHDSLNALALPGGYIFITKGMLQNLTTEAQLAGILGHEVTHVVARDSSAALTRMHVMNLLLAAVLTQETPEGAVQAARLTRLFLDLQYSRKDEQEADLGGLDYMVKAGYNPHGMVETMQMLEDQQTTRPIEFFSTHPAPENRISYLKRKINARYFSLAGLQVGEDRYRTAVLEKLSK
jgi:predicted Zn-dependent protease